MRKQAGTEQPQDKKNALLVGCANDNILGLMVNSDRVHFLWVGEVSNPPHERLLTVLA